MLLKPSAVWWSMGSKLRIHPCVYILVSLWLLVLPGSWSMGAILAAIVHELYHLLAVLLCGGQVMSAAILPDGARMETTPLTYGREALCALAGPLGSFSLMLMAEHFPEAALCGFVQGVYNLLPIYPMDGGRILYCLLPEAAARGVEAFCMTFLAGIGLWLLSYSREVGLIFLLALWNPVIQRKFSCKEHH